MEAKICNKCGAEMPIEAKFCTKCGQSNEEYTSGNHTHNEKLNKKSLYALLTVFTILFLIIFGTMFFSEYEERIEARVAREKFVQDSIKRAEIAAKKAKLEEERIKKEEAKAKSPQAVEKRIKYIYNNVFSGDYNESKWLTSEYYMLLRKEQELTPEGEIGYIDIDHWTQGYDGYEEISMTVLSVEKLADNKAIAKIRLNPLGQNIKLILIYERGDWYIDDFITTYDKKEFSEKEGLKDYISSLSRKSN